MGSTELGELLFTRVTADPAIDEQVKEIVLAAFESDDALVAALEGQATGAPRDSEYDSPAPDGPQGVFVRAIRVRGFRGVGPVAKLELSPGPGLTVVTGRNGSGKSSFAEATELALTGTSARWNKKRHNLSLWQDGWRNLHSSGESEIEIELIAAGARPTTVLHRR